jgi:hypothetical protein
MVSLEFLPIISSAAEGANGMWLQYNRITISLTVPQDSLNLGAVVLDNGGWTMDTMEDSQHQGRALMGLADETCHHCWVCIFAPCVLHVAYTTFSLPGTPLWIAFTYSDMPKIQAINTFFAPAGWYVQST